MMRSLVVLSSLLAFAFAQDIDPATIQATLLKDGVIPDVLPSNFTDILPFDIAFGTATAPITVTAGQNLTQTQTKTPPNFAMLSNNPQIKGKPYLIAIVDPDAPSPPNRTVAQFLHFIGADYIGNTVTNNTFYALANSTPALVEFFPPTPPAGSVPHRYVVACYLQAQTGITPPSGFNASVRTNFNLTTFASKVPGLTLLGATVFWVAPDNSTSSTTSSSTGTATGGASTTGSGTGTGTGSAPATSSTAPASAALMNAPTIWSVLGVLLAASVGSLGL